MLGLLTVRPLMKYAVMGLIKIVMEPTLRVREETPIGTGHPLVQTVTMPIEISTLGCRWPVVPAAVQEYKPAMLTAHTPVANVYHFAKPKAEDVATTFLNKTVMIAIAELSHSP